MGGRTRDANGAVALSHPDTAARCGTCCGFVKPGSAAPHRYRSTLLLN